MRIFKQLMMVGLILSLANAPAESFDGDIAISSRGDVWVLGGDKNHDGYQIFHLLTDRTGDIAVSANGDIYVLGGKLHENGYEIFRIENGQPVLIPSTGAVRIAALKDGPVIVNRIHEIWHNKTASGNGSPAPPGTSTLAPMSRCGSSAWINNTPDIARIIASPEAVTGFQLRRADCGLRRMADFTAW